MRDRTTRQLAESQQQAIEELQTLVRQDLTNAQERRRRVSSAEDGVTVGDEAAVPPSSDLRARIARRYGMVVGLCRCVSGGGREVLTPAAHGGPQLREPSYQPTTRGQHAPAEQPAARW